MQDSQCGRVGIELAFDPSRERPPFFGSRYGENLVIDVSDIANQGDGESSIGEPSTPQVVNESAAKVPDVRRRLNRRATHVDSDVPRNDWFEVTQ
jgi:hypothetical protein